MADPISKDCKYCGSEFTTINGGPGRQRMYCSVNCGKKASFRRKNGPPKRGSLAKCAMCEIEFARDHALHRYCSDYCKRAMARAKAGGQRWYHTASRYGLTRDQVEAMLAAQGGRCAICSVELAGARLERDSPQIDHCHATGKARGILCRLCNTGLGNFRDDRALMRTAIAYLEAHQTS